MSVLDTLGIWLRQSSFPAEFRIDAAGTEGWANAMATAIAETLRALPKPSPPSSTEQTSSPPVASRPSSDGALGRDRGVLGTPFLVPLCNDYFRLRRNLDQLVNEGGTSKEVRGIIRAMENIAGLLNDHGVQCLDLTNKDWEPGRGDFEVIGDAEPVPGLDRKRIIRCERPAVWLSGELLQKARGLIGKPA